MAGIKLDKIVKRRSDGSLWRGSYPDDFGHAMQGLFSGKSHYYFRSIRKLPRQWWQRKDRWEDTGDIWEHGDDNAFDVMEG